MSKKDGETNKEVGKGLLEVFGQKKSYEPDPKPPKRPKRGRSKS